MGLFSRAAKRVTNTLKRVRNTITGRRGAERLRNSPETRKAVAAAKPRSAAKSTRKVPRALEKAESAWKPRATSNFGANLENLKRGVRLASPAKAKAANATPNNWKPFNQQGPAPKKEKTHAEINAMAKKLGLEKGAPALRRQNLLKLGLNAPPGAPAIGPLKGPIRLKGPAFQTRRKPRKAAAAAKKPNMTNEEFIAAMNKNRTVASNHPEKKGIHDQIERLLEYAYEKGQAGKNVTNSNIENLEGLLGNYETVAGEKPSAADREYLNITRDMIDRLKSEYTKKKGANGTEWGNAENLFNLSAQAAASAQPPPSPLIPSSPPPNLTKGKTGTNRNAELAGLFGAATPAASPPASPPINIGKVKRNTYSQLNSFITFLVDKAQVTEDEIDNLEILVNEYEAAINQNSGATEQDRENLKDVKAALEDFRRNPIRRRPLPPGQTPRAPNPFNSPASANLVSPRQSPTPRAPNPFNSPASANSPSPRNTPLEDPIRNRTRSLLRQTRAHFGNNASKHSGNAFSVQELRTLIERFEERLGYGYGTAQENMQDQELLQAAKGILAALERKAADNFDPVFKASPKGANNRMANLAEGVGLPLGPPPEVSPAATPAAPPPIRAPRRLNLQPPSPKAAAANNSDLEKMSSQGLLDEIRKLNPLPKKYGDPIYKRLVKARNIHQARERARASREEPGGAAAGAAAAGRAGNSPVVAPAAAAKKKDKPVAPEDRPIDIAALIRSGKSFNKTQAKHHLTTAIRKFSLLFDQYRLLISKPGEFQVTKISKPTYREYLHDLRNKYKNLLPYITNKSVKGLGKVTAKFYILDTNLLEDQILLNGASSSILDRQAFEVYVLDPMDAERRELNDLTRRIQPAVEPFHATEKGRLYGTRKVPHTKEHEAALERLIGEFNQHIINLEYLYDMFADFFRVMARVKDLELSSQNNVILDTFPTELRAKATLTVGRLTAKKGDDAKVLAEINGMLDAANAVYVGIMDDLLRQQAAAAPREVPGGAAAGRAGNSPEPLTIKTVEREFYELIDMMRVVAVYKTTNNTNTPDSLLGRLFALMPDAKLRDVATEILPQYNKILQDIIEKVNTLTNKCIYLAYTVKSGTLANYNQEDEAIDRRQTDTFIQKINERLIIQSIDVLIKKRRESIAMEELAFDIFKEILNFLQVFIRDLKLLKQRGETIQYQGYLSRKNILD